MTDHIATATKHGATFEQRAGEWFVIHKIRGRKHPLVTLAAPTKEEAARMYCVYFNIPKKDFK